MFADYVYEKSSAEYSNRVLLFDNDGLESRTKYSEYFAANGCNNGVACGTQKSREKNTLCAMKECIKEVRLVHQGILLF